MTIIFWKHKFGNFTVAEIAEIKHNKIMTATHRK